MLSRWLAEPLAHISGGEVACEQAGAQTPVRGASHHSVDVPKTRDVLMGEKGVRLIADLGCHMV